MNYSKLPMYSLMEERALPDMNCSGYLLRHNKSGARVFLVDNADENKVFYIGFRTPPVDSTGLTHILEHSVLCGSKEFPVKDPFVELAKGSLNTFLNAMTYPDKTVYPVASCNDQDFQNLIHVYLDAVFYPNIYARDEIFKQEGWHYELEDTEGEITINGVVYNEMKGAFSSPDDVVAREIMNSLYPDTPYGFESGGDPEVIPELSREGFLNFHKTYYHPSNSYIYLYGDMDFEEKLLWIDEHYLSFFEEKTIATELPLQPAFTEMKEVRKAYSVAEEEEEEGNTYLTMNFSCGDVLDRKLYVAMDILEYALISAPGAPLKQVLLDADLCKDVLSYSDTGIKQPYFSIVAKDCKSEDAERFKEVIFAELTRIRKEGFDKKSLLAGICGLEFRYREADAGRFPIGLTLGLQCMDSWLYDDADPFMHLEQNAVFAELKEAVEEGYFEQLIEAYFLQNPHASMVIVEPKYNLNGANEEALKEKLAAYKASLSAEEIEALVADTKHLKDYQDEPSSQEELKTIPLLEISDIKKEAAGLKNREEKCGETDVIFHDYDSKGIAYTNLIFNLDDLTEEELLYATLLSYVISYVDTKSYNFRDLSNEINIHTGGMSGSIHIFTDAKGGATHVRFTFKTKALFTENAYAFTLIREILTSSNLRDEKRLREILAEMKSRMQMTIASAGHSLAFLRASTYFSESARAVDLTTGIALYHFVDDLNAHFAEQKEEVMDALEKVSRKIFTAERLMVSITADGIDEEAFFADLTTLKEALFENQGIGAKARYTVEQKNEGFQTASKVNYVARCGNYADAGLEYTGALRILKIALSYEYLWLNIRVKGGAYGCMSGFDRNGDSYFVSYRDPHVRETNEIFEGIYDYVKEFDVEERDMVKFIIGTISMMDTPLNASAKGGRSMGMYLNGTTEEDLQKERDQVLGCTCADIRALAPYVQAILAGNYLCAIGDENKMEKEADLFQSLEVLS